MIVSVKLFPKAHPNSEISKFVELLLSPFSCLLPGVCTGIEPLVKRQINGARQKGLAGAIANRPSGWSRWTFDFRKAEELLPSLPVSYLLSLEQILDDQGKKMLNFSIFNLWNTSIWCNVPTEAKPDSQLLWAQLLTAFSIKYSCRRISVRLLAGERLDRKFLEWTPPPPFSWKACYVIIANASKKANQPRSAKRPRWSVCERRDTALFYLNRPSRRSYQPVPIRFLVGSGATTITTGLLPAIIGKKI